MKRVSKRLAVAAAFLAVPALAVLPAAGATTVLTLSPLPGAARILGGNPLLPPELFPPDMSEALGGSVCGPNSLNGDCHEVAYSPLSIPGGVDALNADLFQALAAEGEDGKVIVFAYSQGGQVVQQWMKLFAVPNGGVAPGVNPDNVEFILYANSTRKYGGSLAYGFANLLGQEVMPNSEYKMTDISRQYDYATDFPDDPFNSLAVMNAVMGAMFIHGEYRFLNPDDPGNARWTEGNITYVLIPTQNLPLLEPLRRIGLTALADSLNGPLKAFIELAYRRPAPFPVVTNTDPEDATIASENDALRLSLATTGKSADQRTAESNGIELSAGSNDAQPDQGSNDAQPDQGSNDAQPDQGSNDAQPIQGSNKAEPIQGSGKPQLTEASKNSEPDEGTGEDQTAADAKTTSRTGDTDVQDPATTNSPDAQPEQENAVAPRRAATPLRKPAITAVPGNIGPRQAKKPDLGQASAAGQTTQAPDGESKPAATNSDDQKSSASASNDDKGGNSSG